MMDWSWTNYTIMVEYGNIRTALIRRLFKWVGQKGSSRRGGSNDTKLDQQGGHNRSVVGALTLAVTIVGRLVVWSQTLGQIIKSYVTKI